MERLLPQDVEAEMSVLGAMLLGDKDAAYEGLGLLEEGEFYRDAHGRIWRAMQRLKRADTPLDIVTLKDELERDGILDAIGGVGYLITLGEFVPTTANLHYYAEIVREKAVRRRVIETAGEFAGLAYSGNLHGDELVEKLQQQSMALAAGKRGKGRWKSITVAGGDELDAMQARQRAGTTMLGHSTGFKSLDYALAGFVPGELTIIAARPSMGKTGLGLNIGKGAAETGAAVGFNSLEMPDGTLVQRILAREARIDATKLRRGDLSDAEWRRVCDAYARWMDLPFHIDDKGGVTLSYIAAEARRLKVTHGLDVLMIDHMHIMASPPGAGNRNDELTAISGGLKALAKELDIAVIALAQLSRSVERREDKRPILSDLREGGAIEQDADNVIFLYRPAYYARKEAQKGEDAPPPDPEAPEEFTEEDAEVIIAKQRNGPVGTVPMKFCPQLTSFRDLTPADRF